MLLEDTATPPVLTSMDRKRRQVEVRLLRSLVDSDGAIDELMALWMQAECDGLHNAQTTAALKWMETECGDRIATEETLRDMIAECSSWPEPAARLALLLYSQGRYAESYEYTQMVLQKKPWHFEALQLQVLLFLVSSDRAGAIWAARAGLPGLNQRRKRQAWVSKAVAQATDQLYLLEQQQRQRELVNVQPSSAFYHDGFFESSSGDLQPWQ